MRPPWEQLVETSGQLGKTGRLAPLTAAKGRSNPLNLGGTAR